MVLVFRKGVSVEQAGILALRIFFFVGAIAAILISLLLRTAADRNLRLGNKSIGRFETFMAFALVILALAACFMLYYMDIVIPS